MSAMAGTRTILLGIETSCDETGVALYDTERGLLAHALHSQVTLHDEYGGVVAELEIVGYLNGQSVRVHLSIA